MAKFAEPTFLSLDVNGVQMRVCQIADIFDNRISEIALTDNANCPYFKLMSSGLLTGYGVVTQERLITASRNSAYLFDSDLPDFKFCDGPLALVVRSGLLCFAVRTELKLDAFGECE